MPRLPFGPKGMRKQFANASSQNLSAGPRAQHLSRESSREVSAQGTGSRSPVCDLHAELRCAAFSVARRGPRTKYKLVRACMAQVVLAEAPA